MPSDLRISGWVKSSFVDFPGTVSTVLFLSGCNLRCPYCHNPQVVKNGHVLLEWEPIRDYLEKRRGILDGAVISGGEPTLHSGLGYLCRELKKLGLKIKIDTNGLLPEKIEQNIPDYLALDVKTSLENYKRVKTPFLDSPERLRRSLDIVRSMGECAEVRITAVPGIVDESDVDELCKELAGVENVYIQQFSNQSELLESTFAQKKPFEPEKLKQWQQKFLQAGLNCQVRGV
ncbi:MAG: anaerobic ribonucleoside-triphosphate reductase activating protein [Chitinispirillaceae bacterium]